MAANSADQLIDTVGEWYSKLPPLPKNWTEVIVKIIPWVALIFGALGVLGSIAPFIIAGEPTDRGFFGSLLTFVSSALLLASFSGVRFNKLSGWRLLFWSLVVSLVSNIVYFAEGGVGGILLTLIGFYILFQIKHHYH